MWWPTPLIPALRKRKQVELYKTEANLGYIKSSSPARTPERPCLKKREKDINIWLYFQSFQSPKFEFRFCTQKFFRNTAIPELQNTWCCVAAQRQGRLGRIALISKWLTKECFHCFSKVRCIILVKEETGEEDAAGQWEYNLCSHWCSNTHSHVFLSIADDGDPLRPYNSSRNPWVMGGGWAMLIQGAFSLFENWLTGYFICWYHLVCPLWSSTEILRWNNVTTSTPQNITHLSCSSRTDF